MKHDSTTNTKPPRKKRKIRSVFCILFISVILFVIYVFHNLGGEGIGFGNNRGSSSSSDKNTTTTETIVYNIELTNENTILYQEYTFSSAEQFIQFLKDNYPDNLSSLEVIIHDNKANQNFYASVDVALTQASISHRIADETIR